MLVIISTNICIFSFFETILYRLEPCHTKLSSSKVCVPKTTTERKTNIMYHMHTLGASKCMHVVHSVGFAFGGGSGYTYVNTYYDF